MLTTSVNYSGVITITLTVTESDGSDLQQGTETFILDVVAVNDPPVVSTIADQTTPEETIQTITLAATDSDTDIGNITFSATVTDNSELVGVSVSGNQLTMSPVLDMVGVATISVVADDHESVSNLSDPRTFLLTITNVNDQPYFSDIVTPALIYEDGGSSIVQFTANDVDPDEGVSVSVITNNPTLFPNENIVVIPNGTNTPPVQYVVTLTPAENVSGNAVVIINLSDGEANQSTQVTAEVLPINDTPVLSAIGDQVVEEDDSLMLTLSASDVDTDQSSLTYSVSSSDNVVSSVDGNQLTLSPVPDFFGDETIEVSVSDGNSSDSESIILTVTPVNDAPVITSTAPTSGIISSEYTYQVIVFDADPEDTTFTYELANEPLGMIVSENGLVTWTPNPGDVTSGLVTLTVTDPDFLTDTEDFEVVVDQYDCNGDPGGSAESDDCGVCCGGDTGIECSYYNGPDDFGGLYDCSGECSGTAYLDDCGDCVGGNTGLSACAPYSMDLHAGSNLRSFYALPESPLLSDVFVPNNCDYIGIIGEGEASQFNCDDLNWHGSISELNLFNSFWVKMNNAVTLDVAGLLPESAPTYSLHVGSNMVSYPYMTGNGFFDAIPDDVLSVSAGFIGEGVAAWYLDGPGWVGSLVNGGFIPTMGYIFQMNESVSFEYNAPVMARQSEYSVPSLNEVPSEFKYNQSQTQAFYFIEDVNYRHDEITTDDWIIAYHEGNVIGARQWLGTISDIPVMGYDGSEGTDGYITEGQTPEFKLYDYSKRTLVNLEVNAPAWNNLGLYLLGEVSTHVELP
ncbi:MAG: Ig-like domain-containing protein, partial [Fidelibacterota bacterium]